MTQVTPLATASHPFTIAGVRVRQDAQGRYCLNDLHKAAVAQGANKRTSEPNKFFRSQHIQDLVDLLNAEIAAGNYPESDAQIRVSLSVEANRTGRYEERGTYVVRELVYAYAMFISAEFHLTVIRTFDSLVNQQHAMPHIQSAKFWDRLRPHWRAIADLALAGLKNVQIAPLVERSAASVGRCLARMYEVGYLNPVEVFVARLKPATARRWALSKPVALGWGRPAQPSLQGDLFVQEG